MYVQKVKQTQIILENDEHELFCGMLTECLRVSQESGYKRKFKDYVEFMEDLAFNLIDGKAQEDIS